MVCEQFIMGICMLMMIDRIVSTCMEHIVRSRLIILHVAPVRLNFSILYYQHNSLGNGFMTISQHRKKQISFGVSCTSME